MNKIAYYNARDSIHQKLFTRKRQPLSTLLESEEDTARSVCEEIKGYGVQISEEASIVASENSQGSSTEEFYSKM